MALFFGKTVDRSNIYRTSVEIKMLEQKIKRVWHLSRLLLMLVCQERFRERRTIRQTDRQSDRDRQTITQTDNQTETDRQLHRQTIRPRQTDN